MFVFGVRAGQNSVYVSVGEELGLSVETVLYTCNISVNS